MNISAQTLLHHIECERRVWLDAFGDPSHRRALPPSAPSRIGVQHEQSIHAATLSPLQTIEVFSWDEGVQITRDLLRQDVRAITGAHLEHPLDLDGQHFTVRGQVDQLVRIARHEYAIGEINQRAAPADPDWLQLDLYVWLLHQFQGFTPPAELWLGINAYGQPRARIEHEYDESRLFAAFTQIAALLDPSVEPPVTIDSYCKPCPWYAACTAVAQQQGSLDLLYHVSHKTRDSLRAAGITTLTQVAAMSAADLQQIKGIGPITAPAIRANAQAWTESRPIHYTALPAVCTEPGWMFDLETLDSGLPWCLGWCDVHGQTSIALVAPVDHTADHTLPDGQHVTLAPDTASLWRALAQALSSSDCPIFHWTGYDSGILHATAPDDVRAALGPRMHDLHRSFSRSISLPTKSTSIKIVSTYLGYPWPGYNDWFAAFMDYRRWLEDDDLDALMRACKYQRADVESMAWVWRWLNP